MSRRCPEPDPKLADIAIEPWQNFSGEHAEYADRMEALGITPAPRHARIELTHRCDWAASLPAGPLSAARVVKEIAEHLGLPLLTEIGSGVRASVSRDHNNTN